MESAQVIRQAISQRKNRLIFVLQLITAVGVLITLSLLFHVGPLTLFSFMTLAQFLILFSLVGATILLLTQKSNINRERFAPGRTIFRKGEIGNKLYIVADGEVEVLDEETGGGERIIAKLGPGQCFGEMALVNDNPRMATVQSRTRVNLISLDREGFQELFGHLEPLRRMFEEVVEERSRGKASP